MAFDDTPSNLMSTRGNIWIIHLPSLVGKNISFSLTLNCTIKVKLISTYQAVPRHLPLIPTLMNGNWALIRLILLKQDKLVFKLATRLCSYLSGNLANYAARQQTIPQGKNAQLFRSLVLVCYRSSKVIAATKTASTDATNTLQFKSYKLVFPVKSRDCCLPS